MTGPDATPPSIVVIVDDPDELPPGLTVEASPAPLTFVWDLPAARDALPGADVVFLWRMRSRLLAQAWESATTLRWVHTVSAGLDLVLFPELVRSDVVVTNSRGVYDQAMAEYALALMLAAAKDLPATLALQREREWVFRYTETLTDKRLLVVGPGSIGRAVARLAAAFGMRPSAVGRSSRDGDPDFPRIAGAEGLLDAMAEADYVVLTVPLTDESRGMIDEKALGAMKPTARLINLARGAVIDEGALIDALREGRIAGAGLDVFAAEPLDPSSPLWDMPNVVVSPHISGDSDTSERAVVELFLDNLGRWTSGEPLRNVVDKELGFVAGP